MSFIKKITTSVFTTAILTVLVILTKCNEKPAQVANPVDKNIKTETIAKDPSQFIGKTVSVTGEIKELQKNSAYTIRDRNFFEGEEILVLNESGKAMPAIRKDKNKVKITGKIGKFNWVNEAEKYNLY